MGKSKKTLEKAANKAAETAEPISVREALKVPRGPVGLADYDPAGKPGFLGNKADGEAAMPELGTVLGDLQERLFAEGRTGGSRRVLLVLQGMDTSGKGGVMRHAVGLFDPQGVRIKSFRAPTASERRHEFLWRIRRELPGPGVIGIFDRSHYEDVLIARVRKLATATEIRGRYRMINDFEKELVESGTVVVKCMLHISKKEQKSRLLARLDDPTKLWKFNPGDIDERARWDDYQRAYETAIEKTNTVVAPWMVVPSDRKWYRNWAIAAILKETLEGMGLSWPEADFDIEAQRRRLLEEDTGSA